MADLTNDTSWLMPKFGFSVDIGGMQNVPFQEVSGLEAQTRRIEVRAGNGAAFSTIKMPGIAQVGNVTLKRGIFPAGNTFWDWCSQIKTNIIQRAPVTIRLLDEGGNPVMVWTLQNAWTTKISGPDLKADGNEVAVDTLELACESVTVASN